MKKGKFLSGFAALVCAVTLFVTEAQAAAYETGTLENLIKQAFDNRTATIDVLRFGMTVDEFYEVFKKVLFDNPKYFYVERVYRGNPGIMQFQYLFSEEETAAMQSEIDAEMQRIMTHVSDDMTDVQKACAVHDYMALTYDYTRFEDNSELGFNDYSLYGIMTEKKGVCQAYAQAYQYAMQFLGINTKFVEGFGDDGSHAWNYIELDGSWYHVDVTWDDPIVYYTDRYITHEYFLVSDDTMLQDHTWEASEYPVSPADYPDRSKLIFSMENGIRYSFDRTVLYDYPPGLMDARFDIPDGVYAVADDTSSWYNTFVTEVYIPSSVIYISSRAFEGFKNLNVIYGEAGSSAEKFAQDNGYAFEIQSKALPQGDVNGDRDVNVNDALLVLQMCAEVAELDGSQTKLADMNGDATVSVYDVYLILSLVSEM